jgi:hypothetical protein
LRAVLFAYPLNECYADKPSHALRLDGGDLRGFRKRKAKEAKAAKGLKPDNPAQSKRFVEAAKELGVDPDAFKRALDKIAPKKPKVGAASAMGLKKRNAYRLQLVVMPGIQPSGHVIALSKLAAPVSDSGRGGVGTIRADEVRGGDTEPSANIYALKGAREFLDHRARIVSGT